MTDLCPACGQALPAPPDYMSDDKRANYWRLRLRLYSSEGSAQEPVADSDPELPPDRMGTVICRSLPAVADYLRDTAMAFHMADEGQAGQPVTGLDRATLDRRIKGLRPTLSRRGGNAVLRVAYQTPGKGWMARIDLERAD